MALYIPQTWLPWIALGCLVAAVALIILAAAAGDAKERRW